MENSKDLEKLEEKKRKNRKQRLDFVKRWAEYVRDNPDEDWSGQQKTVLEK
ncbi:MAG: hypothetical protein ABEJ56_03565 [Candidatus Nanohaloarchaea archaeon]